MTRVLPTIYISVPHTKSDSEYPETPLPIPDHLIKNLREIKILRSLHIQNANQLPVAVCDFDPYVALGLVAQVHPSC